MEIKKKGAGMEMTEVDKKNQALENLEHSTGKRHLENCRKKARHYCYTNRGNDKYKHPYSVTSDDVRELMEIETIESGSKFPKANNINGRIFWGDDWIFTGEYHTSKAKNSHGNKIKIWQLKKLICNYKQGDLFSEK